MMDEDQCDESRQEDGLDRGSQGEAGRGTAKDGEMLAGGADVRRKERQEKHARHAAAALAVAGISRPAAPRISRTSVTVTSRAARGIAGGTMRIRSARPLPQ